ARKVALEFKADFDSGALIQAVGKPGDSCGEAHFVEKRRMKKVGESAYLVFDLTRDLPCRLKPVLNVSAWLHGTIKADGKNCKLLTCIVVQVARHAAALLVLHLQDSGGERLNGSLGCFERFSRFKEFSNASSGDSHHTRGGHVGQHHADDVF